MLSAILLATLLLADAPATPVAAADTLVRWQQPRDTTITTILFVRHAEKNTMMLGADVPLSAVGERRAQALARVAGEAGVTALYASTAKRAIDTLRPVAALLGDSITIVQDKAETARRLSHNHWGETVLVAGHADSVPEIIEAITHTRIPPFGEAFDIMYVVTLTRDGRSSIVRLRYGE